MFWSIAHKSDFMMLVILRLCDMDLDTLVHYCLEALKMFSICLLIEQHSIVFFYLFFAINKNILRCPCFNMFFMNVYFGSCLRLWTRMSYDMVFKTEF